MAAMNIGVLAFPNWLLPTHPNLNHPHHLELSAGVLPQRFVRLLHRCQCSRSAALASPGLMRLEEVSFVWSQTGLPAATVFFVHTLGPLIGVKAQIRQTGSQLPWQLLSLLLENRVNPDKSMCSECTCVMVPTYYRT